MDEKIDLLEGIPEIAQEICRLRARAGMTQVELADKLRMDRANLRRIEAGRQNLTVELAKRIFAALGCKSGFWVLPPAG